MISSPVIQAKLKKNAYHTMLGNSLKKIPISRFRSTSDDFQNL